MKLKFFLLIGLSVGITLVCSLVFLYCFAYAKGLVSSCKECHKGIEVPSRNHDFACINCHGGKNREKMKEKAHTGMLGGKNPSSPDFWDITCGKCHQYQYDRVKSNIMHTNVGIIKNTMLAWNKYQANKYATKKLNGYDEKGNPIEIKSVANLNNIAGEVYRKFCSGCHVGYDRWWGYKAQHVSGCAACHFSRSESNKYEGKDKAIKGKSGYAKTHQMNKLPGDDVCIRCHNRSGRISLSFSGFVDGNNALVPTKDGYPGPKLISGIRNVHSIKKDVHKEYGMECIDCHTSRDTMGDGYVYENMYRQTEISCEDCHGSPEKMPLHKVITKENDPPLIESRNYKKQVKYGTKMVLTSKGRMYSNVFYDNGEVFLFTKRGGKTLKIKTITNTDEHSIKGHKRLECYTCHSRTVPQCYGCHMKYDKTKSMHDLIKNKKTKGLFSETEDLRTLYPFPLALNQRGKISPVTPGCQTLLTFIDEDGEKLLSEHIFSYRGRSQFKFAPFYSHNTGKRAVSCAECHGNPAFVGFGQGLVSLKEKTITSPVLCDTRDEPLDAFLYVKNAKLFTTSDIVRENSRVLNIGEINRFFKVNLCIVCHDQADRKIYGKKIDYKRLEDCLHRPIDGGK